MGLVTIAVFPLLLTCSNISHMIFHVALNIFAADKTYLGSWGCFWPNVEKRDTAPCPEHHEKF